MTLSFEKSFSYVFKDPQWVSKLAMASLFGFLSLFFIGGPFLNGYVVRVMRWRLQGKEGLPDWDGLGEMFMDGLKVMLIGFIYALPVLLLAIIIGVFMSLIAIFAGDNELFSFFPLLILPFQGMIMLYALCLFLIQPWTLYTVAAGLPLTAAFHLKPYFQAIKKDGTNAILSLLCVWLVSSLSGFGLFLFFIGIFVALGYMTMVMGDLYGRLMAHWKAEGWLA